MIAILTSYMNQNWSETYFKNILRVLIIFLCDVKINVIMCEPHCVTLFLCEICP